MIFNKYILLNSAFAGKKRQKVCNNYNKTILNSQSLSRKSGPKICIMNNRNFITNTESVLHILYYKSVKQISRTVSRAVHEGAAPKLTYIDFDRFQKSCQCKATTKCLFDCWVPSHVTYASQVQVTIIFLQGC